MDDGKKHKDFNGMKKMVNITDGVSTDGWPWQRLGVVG